MPFNAVHTPIEAPEKYQRRFADEPNDKQRAYNAMTSALDDAVGAILHALTDQKLDERTLVIFLNDNGGPVYTRVQSNGPLRLGKLFLFEGGIRVPMLIRWNGHLPAGRVFDPMVSSLDLFPTICAAAGIGNVGQLALDGVDLVPFINGTRSGKPHDALFWSNGPNQAIRRGDWKLVRSKSHTWLFDVHADPGEKNNLNRSKPEVVEQLSRELDDWRSQMPAPAWPSKPQRRKIEIDGGIYELNI